MSAIGQASPAITRRLLTTRAGVSRQAATEAYAPVGLLVEQNVLLLEDEAGLLGADGVQNRLVLR